MHGGRVRRFLSEGQSGAWRSHLRAFGGQSYMCYFYAYVLYFYADFYCCEYLYVFFYLHSKFDL